MDLKHATNPIEETVSRQDDQTLQSFLQTSLADAGEAINSESSPMSTDRLLLKADKNQFLVIIGHTPP